MNELWWVSNCPKEGLHIVISHNNNIDRKIVLSALNEGKNPHILATETLRVGISKNVAIYFFNQIVYEEISELKTLTSSDYDLIDLDITRFCEVEFDNGRKFYSFGNILGKDAVIIRPVDVTRDMKNLIGVKLRDVQLRIIGKKTVLVKYSLR